MEQKKLVGYRRPSETLNANIEKAKKVCKIANNEVIPLMVELGQTVTIHTALQGVGNRAVIIEKAVEDTLSLKEYAQQPQLLKNAVAKLREEEVRNLASAYGLTTQTVADGVADICVMNDDNTLGINEEVIKQKCEVWANGAEEIAALDAYTKVVEALNALYPNGVPSSTGLEAALGLVRTGVSGTLKVDANRWNAVLRSNGVRSIF